jgi:ubiquinone/menaquinone biosynthesis C-methylase UbiE
MSESFNSETYQSDNYRKYTTSSRLYQWHIRAFQQSLFDLIQMAEPSTVLDAGCGEGFVVNYLLSRDPQLRVTGIDYNADAIAFARHHFGEEAEFRKASVYSLPFDDRSFDTVICSEVLEHLHDHDAAVRELKRVALRYVLITVPREPYFKWLNDIGQFLQLCGDPGHVNFWTEESFEEFIVHHFSDPVFTVKNMYQLALAEL